jgi:hypothetical protein
MRLLLLLVLLQPDADADAVGRTLHAPPASGS